ERFAPVASARRHRFAYLPFGGGPRICIGNNFAMAEAQVILAAIAQRYRIRLAPGREVTPIGKITLRPRGGVGVTLEPRRAAAAGARRHWLHLSLPVCGSRHAHIALAPSRWRRILAGRRAWHSRVALRAP